MKNLPLTSAHLLGANSQGQDIFGSWSMPYAIRSFSTSCKTVSIFTTLIATTIGLSSGFIGGWYDRIIMTITNSIISIPTFPILIVLGTLLRGNVLVCRELFWSSLDGHGVRVPCVQWR